MKNWYIILGVGLCCAGAVFAPVSYFVIDSVALTALAVSAMIVGFTSIALSNTRPNISPEACELMLKTGTENTAALLEELNLQSKAIYLPSSSRSGVSQAIIPLAEGDGPVQPRGNISGRLIVRYGPNSGDMALAVATPGSINIKMLDARPGPTADDIESAATHVLVGILDIATSVTVRLSEELIEVEVAKPRMRQDNVWYYSCLGSPIASIVAAISSEALEKPIRVKEESYSAGKSKILLEVLS